MTAELPKIPGYTVTRLVGRGGMANVYEGMHKSLQRKVAIKLMHSHLSDVDNASHDRFLREARLTARLHHPNIVQVYDAGLLGDEQPYMVMQYVEGPTLHNLIQAKGTMAPITVLSVGRKLASALAHAHEGELIHRDVKPMNIMLDRRDKRVMLTDFGIARLREDIQNLTLNGAIVGTPKYLSPELAKGGKITDKADIYALGIILYEMLTGHVPFESESPLTLLMHHAHTPLPHLPTRFAILDELMQLLCSKDPEDRPGAKELERELRQLMTVADVVTLPALDEPIAPDTNVSQTDVLAAIDAEKIQPQLVIDTDAMENDALKGGQYETDSAEHLNLSDQTVTDMTADEEVVKQALLNNKMPDNVEQADQTLILRRSSLTDAVKARQSREKNMKRFGIAAAIIVAIALVPLLINGLKPTGTALKIFTDIEDGALYLDGRLIGKNSVFLDQVDFGSHSLKVERYNETRDERWVSERLVDVTKESSAISISATHEMLLEGTWVTPQAWQQRRVGETFERARLLLDAGHVYQPQPQNAVTVFLEAQRYGLESEQQAQFTRQLDIRLEAMLEKRLKLRQWDEAEELIEQVKQSWGERPWMMSGVERIAKRGR